MSASASAWSAVGFRQRDAVGGERARARARPSEGSGADLDVLYGLHLVLEAAHDALAELEAPERHRSPVDLLVGDSDRDQLLDREREWGRPGRRGISGVQGVGAGSQVRSADQSLHRVAPGAGAADGSRSRQRGRAQAGAGAGWSVSGARLLARAGTRHVRA